MTPVTLDDARAERLDELDDTLDDAVVRLRNLAANREVGETLEERCDRPRDSAVAADPRRGHPTDTDGLEAEHRAREHAHEHAEARDALDRVRARAVIEREVTGPENCLASVLDDEGLPGEQQAELVPVAIRVRRERCGTPDRVRRHFEPAQRERTDDACLKKASERGAVVRRAFEWHEELGARRHPQLRPVLDRDARRVADDGHPGWRLRGRRVVAKSWDAFTSRRRARPAARCLHGGAGLPFPSKRCVSSRPGPPRTSLARP